jgi:N-methylhydantoinase A/oxoprolinase/acetone carboxylase beta subunit
MGVVSLSRHVAGTLFHGFSALRRKSLASLPTPKSPSPPSLYTQERRAAEIAADYFADVSVSSEIGQLGLLERENSAVVNASLRDLAARTIRAFQDALKRLGLGAPLFITQNDGTLMTCGMAARYPVLTFNSGATNSMRGAAYLSGVKDAIVLDVGGTSTDVGRIAGGLAVDAAADVELSGGVVTNFRMPDVHCFNLGGGTKVHVAEDGDVKGGSQMWRRRERRGVLGVIL